MLRTLPHLIEILEPTRDTDAYGTPSSKVTYPDSGPKVRAFVQPRATREINVGAERSTSTSDYIAYVDTADLTHRAHIRWNGLTLSVEGVRIFDAPSSGTHTAIDLRLVTD